MKRDGSDGRCVKNYKNTEQRLTLPASSQEKLKKKKKMHPVVKIPFRHKHNFSTCSGCVSSIVFSVKHAHLIFSTSQG